MRDMKIWQSILDQPDDETLCLIIVSNSAGSSPGKKGFKMVVNADGRLAGTIGGGIMEKRIIDSVISNLDTPKNRFQRLDHRKGSEHASGLNCSGWQEIIIAYISPEERQVISDIVTSYHDKSSTTLFVYASFITLFPPATSEELLYQELVAQPDLVYIFGGGHVGTAIANQLILLDYNVTVFDPREEISKFHPDPKSYTFKNGTISDLQSTIIEGNHTYLIITSNSIDNDIEALRYCMEKNVKYIGFMGSKSKIQMAKTRLNSDLNEIHTPIGIKLPNETPAEIAVSVAAELITIKNS